MLEKLWGTLEMCRANEIKGKELAKNRPPPSSEEAIEEETKRLNVTGNNPFECCIREFGVEIAEAEEDKASAGEGKRWKRMFGLFGTKLTRS
jgi:protection of telomeres protein 1